jgi:FAD/FMN-containing dehydrogenase
VKNVAGYDLHKLLIGSLGTLAVITRLNFRTFPSVIDGSRGFLASFSTYQAALALRRKIIESRLSPLTLDVLNPTAAQIFAARTPVPAKLPGSVPEDPKAPQTSLPLTGEWFRSHEWQVCAAFTGTTEVLDRYARDLNRFAEESRATTTTILDNTTRPSIWGRLREVLHLFRESSPAATILQLNTLPDRHAQAINLLEAVARSAQMPLAIVARATGTLYVAILPDAATADQAQASPNQVQLEKLALLAQEVIALRGGYGEASLVFAPPSLTKHLALPAPPPFAKALARRLKSAFDPDNIFATRSLGL